MRLQVNGREVGRDPRVLQEELQAASGNVFLKILPSYHEAIPPRQVIQSQYETNQVLIVLWIVKWAEIMFNCLFYKQQQQKKS